MVDGACLESGQSARNSVQAESRLRSEPALNQSLLTVGLTVRDTTTRVDIATFSNAQVKLYESMVRSHCLKMLYWARLLIVILEARMQINGHCFVFFT